MKHQLRNPIRFILATTLCLYGGAVNATLGKETGGGDLCEKRIKAIAQDVKTWIDAGGPNGLVLSGTSTERYSASMLKQIEKAHVKCVAPGDDGFPVEVYGTPKTCKFVRDEDRSTITCDIQKFSNIDESDQYVLIHHEYAGLAGLENPDEDNSNYHISDQIAGFLEDTVVKKLVVRPTRSSHDSSLQGQYLLDFYASSGSCEKLIIIQLETNEVVVKHEPTAWGDHYRLGSFCRDRSTSDIPPNDVESCSTYVETNTLSNDERAFENIMTLPAVSDGPSKRQPVSRFALKLISEDLLQTDLVGFDRDGLVEPVSRCVYNRTN